MRTFSISARRQLPRRLWMAFILCAVLLLATFQPSTPAFSQDQEYAYYWSLTFDFEGSSKGSLYVAVGYNDDGDVQDPPIYTQTHTVPCTRTGNATVSGGALTLNGGYLSCELDIQGALQDAFTGCDAIVPGCHKDIEEIEPYANFRAMAKVMSANPGEAPVFYHDDASYAINPQSTSTQIVASISPHGVIPSTAVMSVPALNVWQSYTAEYLCDPSCEMYYGAAGAVEVVVTPDEDVMFHTPSTTVYVGYNPVTGVIAPAGTAIDKLFIDPPNYGND